DLVSARPEDHRLRADVGLGVRAVVEGERVLDRDAAAVLDHHDLLLLGRGSGERKREGGEGRERGEAEAFGGAHAGGSRAGAAGLRAAPTLHRGGALAYPSTRAGGHRVTVEALRTQRGATPLRERGRFAPSPSGPAHPGTLLAGLLAWLDARSRGAGFALRLEDVDTERCTPEHAREMRDALRWLGLDWDAESVQSERRAAHEAALDALAATGWLYPCRCSRAELRRGGRPTLD